MENWITYFMTSTAVVGLVRTNFWLDKAKVNAETLCWIWHWFKVSQEISVDLTV